jgi:hypothetical protein
MIILLNQEFELSTVTNIREKLHFTKKRKKFELWTVTNIREKLHFTKKRKKIFLKAENNLFFSMMDHRITRTIILSSKSTWQRVGRFVNSMSTERTLCSISQIMECQWRSGYGLQNRGQPLGVKIYNYFSSARSNWF